jgi:GAF domain-containing protein
MGDDLETAAEYLQFHNFKSMVEWMTAEVILSRPDDPFQFLGGMLRSKVRARGGADYDPAGTSDLVRKCYSLAAQEADEHGRIRGSGAKGFGGDDDDDEFGDIDFGGSKKSSGGGGKVALSGDVARRVEGLERVLSASRRVGGSLEVGAVAAAIMEETTHLVGCARAELHMCDAQAQTLTPFEAGTGNRLASVPVGGVPGTVLQRGRVLNEKTASLLGVPILGQGGDPVAVLVAAEKSGGGAFNRADEEVRVVFAGQVAVLLGHALLCEESAQAEQQAQRLMEFLGEVCRGDLKSPRALIAAVANGGMDLVEADRCSFYLKDDGSGDLWSLSGGAEGDVQHFPLDAGILGFVATRGETINVADAAADPRFDKSHDLRSGYETKTLLCMPLADAAGNLVAVIQFLNKLGGGAFQTRDEDTIRRMAGVLGPLVATMPNGASGGDSISM